MTRPVSIVIPCAGERAALERSLPVLLAELERRAAGDEVLLVDDGGGAGLEAWAAERFPPPATFERARAELRTLTRARRGGRSAALRTGCEEATHAHVLLLDPALQVEPGFLEPLLAALEDTRVFAACPRTDAALERPAWRASELVLERASDPAGDEPFELAFLTRAAALVRRDELLARGFDPLFEPDAWLERELAWSVRREGRTLLCVPRSRARLLVEPAPAADEHAQRTRAAILAERGRLLCTWKHLDDEALWRAHRAALLARVAQAVARGERESLLALALALEDLPALARGRPAGHARVGFAALAREPGSARELEGAQRDA